jgi:hypothetical protein
MGHQAMRPTSTHLTRATKPRRVSVALLWLAVALLSFTPPGAHAYAAPDLRSDSALSSEVATTPFAGLPGRPATKLTAPPEMNSNFGSSVAITADGQTAVVGGETDNGGAGAAWVFVRRAGAWIQQGPKLAPTDPGGGARFGAHVAVSANGATILIGDGEGRIAAWVFTRVDGLWRQRGRRLSPTGREAKPDSDSHVALSGDGSTAVITGEVTEDVEAQGVAWIFAPRGANWRQRARLKGSGGSESSYSAALSASGKTLLLGTGELGYSGSAWVFQRRGSHWRQQGPTLPRSGSQGFGVSVALSANGKTALVGAPRIDSGPGAAFLYALSRGRWIARHRLAPSTHTRAVYFGSFVALSADGRTAVVNSPTSFGGSAYVFTRSRRRWLRSAHLTGGAGFSDTLAVSADGDTVLAPPAPTRPPGVTYVFDRVNSTWTTQTGSLLPVDESGRDNADFGYEVALSADGDTALVAGAGVWSFVRSSGSWLRQGSPLIGPSGAGGGASSIALSADGSTAVVGEAGEKGSPGVVLVFVRSGEAWTQQGPGLTPTAEASPAPSPSTAGGGFGTTVAVSATGNTVLVGGPGVAGHAGAAWVFAREGEGWTEQGSKLTASDEVGEGSFGSSVALSADGDTALVGGETDNSKAFSTGTANPGTLGAAWLFARSGGVWTQQAPKLTAGSGGQNFFGDSVSLSADADTALIGSRGSGFVFTRTGATWSEQTTLASSRASSNAFGESVALSADGDAALIGGLAGMSCGKYMNELCSFTGTAWAFARSGDSWARQPSPLTGPGAFGSSVALSANGESALVGDPVGDIASLQGGSAFALQLTSPS